MPGSRTAERVVALTAARVPFVHATVVRAQCPTSSNPGDAAVVLPDGSIEGFVGGQCAESSVAAAARRALETREAILLRILPEGEEGFPESPGAVTVVNPCLSGGALEIFLEPRLPAPLLAVVGSTPIADAVTTLAGPLGFATETVPSGHAPPEASTAVIVSSHGRDEASTIRAALDAGVGFVGLVASRRRGASVLEEMALSADERARVHTPVGVEIGARTAEEIALSIMAAVVRAIRVEGLVPPLGAPAPATFEVVDPVCGMPVVVGPDTPHVRTGDEDHWFCSTGCRDRYVA